MRVLYVTAGIAPHSLGGMQAVARMHVERLAERGSDLAIVHCAGAEATAKGDLPGREYPLSWPVSKGIGRRIPGHYASELRRYSYEVARIARTERPDVVYSEGPLAHALLIDAAEQYPPVVFHPHGLEMFQDQGSWFHNLRSRPLRGIVRLHAARAARVISQGGDITQLLVQRCGAKPDAIRRLPNALNESALCGGPRGLEGAVRFLFIGRDEPRKGLRLLLAAMPQVPGASLDIVGPHAQTAAARSEGQVVWHGEVRDRARLWEIFAQCHYLVLPSYAEGLPTVLLEAMARGLPCIASRVGAVPEVVVPGQTGWLVPPGSVDRLGAALAEAAGLDPARYRAMSGTALEKIRGGYLQEHAGDTLLAILDDAAAMRPSSAVPL